jgi:hypothetical protein
MEFISNELVTLTDLGIGLQWTLANVPVSGTEHLFGCPGTPSVVSTASTNMDGSSAPVDYDLPNGNIVPGTIVGTAVVPIEGSSPVSVSIIDDGEGNIYANDGSGSPIIATINYVTGVVTILLLFTFLDAEQFADMSISGYSYYVYPIAAQSNVRLISGLDYTISGAVITTTNPQISILADYCS